MGILLYLTEWWCKERILRGGCSKMQFSQTAFVVRDYCTRKREEGGDEVVFFKKTTTIEFQSKAPTPLCSTSFWTWGLLPSLWIWKVNLIGFSIGKLCLISRKWKFNLCRKSIFKFSLIRLIVIWINLPNRIWNAWKIAWESCFKCCSYEEWVLLSTTENCWALQSMAEHY